MEEMEEVVFPAKDEDGSVPASGDVAVANGDGPPSASDGPLAHPLPLPLPAQMTLMMMSYPQVCHPTMMTMSKMSIVPHLEFESGPGVTRECRRLGEMIFSRWPQTS